jgi:ribonuclease VapC
VSNVVLDTSAIIAVIKGERGADRVRPFVPGAVVSAVTVAELASVLTRGGAPPEAVAEAIDDFQFAVEPFDRPRALAAGLLIAKTGRGGLSLGDRACIALAIELGLPAMTADHPWRDLDLGVEVQFIR